MRWALLALLLLVPQQDAELLVLRPRLQYPTALHAAVLTMVEGCTGRQYNGRLQWATADTLASYPSGVMSYGVLLRRNDDSPLVIVQTPFFLNVAVLSHELVHLVANGDEVSPEMERCVMSIGLDMHERSLTPEQLESVRNRALRVSVYGG